MTLEVDITPFVLPTHRCGSHKGWPKSLILQAKFGHGTVDGI